MCGMNHLADMVRRERLQRGLSVRQAAAAGGISNTYWARFEDYKQALNDGITAAVTQAFDWPSDWADEVSRPVAGRDSTVETLRIEVTRLAAIVDRVELELAALRSEAASPGSSKAR